MKLEPLERLDLRKCTSVGQIVMAMNQCSFGARMLGETALKIHHWIQNGRPIRAVYDGKPLLGLLESMQQKGWIHSIIQSTSLDDASAAGFEHIVIGRYSEALDERVGQLEGAIFI